MQQKLEIKKVDIEKHNIIVKFSQYRGFDDCTLYIIKCSCGKDCGGWTPKQAEDDYNKHFIKKVRRKE